MRFTLAAASVALLAASAQATLWCKDRGITEGILRIHKNSTSGETHPLGFGSKKDKDGNAYLTVQESQPIFSFLPCDSAFIGKPGEYGTNGTLTAYGKITFGGKCLSRLPSDGGLVLGPCAIYDGTDQDAQFFKVAFPYYPPAGDVVGTYLPVTFVKAGTYHQLSGGTIYGP